MPKVTYVAIGVVLLVSAGVAAAVLTDNSTATPDQDAAVDSKAAEEPERRVVGVAPTESDLSGRWLAVGEGIVVQFGGRDGSVNFARGTDADALAAPTASGSYSIDGNLVSFTGGCLDGQVWETGLIKGYSPSDDALQVRVVAGGCGASSGVFWDMVRVGG